MRFSFNSDFGLVLTAVTVEGPAGTAVLRLALDTGATATLINIGMLVAVGYDPALSSERIEVTTGSGIEYTPRINVAKVSALGQERLRFPVLGHTLPPSTGIDGLLGLDFLRDRTLKIDFRQGTLELD